MLTLSDRQLDILEDLVPDFAPSPKGGRPPVSKRQALAGILGARQWSQVEGSAGAIWFQEQRALLDPYLGQGRGLRRHHALIGSAGMIEYIAEGKVVSVRTCKTRTLITLKICKGRRAGKSICRVTGRLSSRLKGKLRVGD